MIFVTGPMYSGKEKCICELLNITHDRFSEIGVRDAERLVASGDSSVEALADELNNNEIVISSEIGCGVISTDPDQNLYRERAGRLAQELSKRAEVVVRVVCGLPQILKGDLSKYHA